MPTEFQLVINTKFRHANFKCTSDLAFTNPDIVAVLSRCDFMHALTPLLTVTFDRVGTTYKWLYEIELVDGRTWSQEITYADLTDPDPPMTFVVPDAWRLTEFTRHRDIREIMTKLRLEKGLEKVTIEYGEF